MRGIDGGPRPEQTQAGRVGAPWYDNHDDAVWILFLSRQQIKLKAAGFELPTPLPFGASAYFAMDGAPLTVQLVNSDGSCWSSDFTGALHTSNVLFSAKFP